MAVGNLSPMERRISGVFAGVFMAIATIGLVVAGPADQADEAPAATTSAAPARLVEADLSTTAAPTTASTVATTTSTTAATTTIPPTTAPPVTEPPTTTQPPTTLPPTTEPPTTAAPPPPPPPPPTTAAPAPRDGVRPGAFCSPEGAEGYTDAGTYMVCSTNGEPRARWRAG